MARRPPKARTKRAEDGRWAVVWGAVEVGRYISRATAWRVARRVTDWQDRNGNR